MAQYAIEKFAKKLLGDSEVEAVLQRLNRLTQDEARTTVAQTLGVVHGLVGNMKIVMEGAESLHNCSTDIFLTMIYFVRWQGINGDYSAGSGYVSHAEQVSTVLTRFCSRSSPDVKRNEQDQTFVLFLLLLFPRPTVSCRSPAAI